MNYPERGATVYDDLLYLLVFVCTNVFILAALFGIVFLVMLSYGYKSITIKFSKKQKWLKQTKHNQKIKEKSYFSKLDKKMKNEI